MLKNRIRRVYKRVIMLLFSNRKKCLDNSWNIEKDSIFKYFEAFIITDLNYSIRFESIPESTVAQKWVGGQIFNDRIIAIPNDETRALVKGSEWDVAGELKTGLFKWTGGCVWNGEVYAFPRTSNNFLKIGKEIKEIPLTYSYTFEHHYSGTCTKDGVVYQPPRNTNHILKTDLKTGKSTKINIIPDCFRIRFRYCGSIIHPNGYIYFFPENNDKVIKLNPQNDEWSFIGERITTMVFDAKVGLDGNIYGYSAYNKGIMKIEVDTDNVSMIHTDINPGAYGTKYGIDGCLYSVPGDGSKVWKYDVLQDNVSEIADLESDENAKYAGGVVNRNGEIYCIPATSNNVLVLKPNIGVEIPEEVYNTFFVDNY